MHKKFVLYCSFFVEKKIVINPQICSSNSVWQANLYLCKNMIALDPHENGILYSILIYRITGFKNNIYIAHIIQEMFSMWHVYGNSLVRILCIVRLKR